MALLDGKTGVIFGVANKRSIAWAIAQALAREGMRLAFTYQGERLKENVAELASTIPNVSYDQGLRIADRIHNTGRAIVWSGHRERAELYWEQLRGHGLTMAPLES